MQPAIVEQGSNTRVPAQDVGHGLLRRLDTDRQTQRFVSIALAIMDRLPGQAGAQHAAIAQGEEDLFEEFFGDIGPLGDGGDLDEAVGP